MENQSIETYLLALESKIRKLVSEHQSLKRELFSSMEENRILSLNNQNLEDEIQRLNTAREEQSHEQGFNFEELEHLKSENNRLLEALNIVQEHFKDVQNKSEVLILEYDKLKEEFEILSKEKSEMELSYENQLNANTQLLNSDEKEILEKESLKIQLEAAKLRNEELREINQKREEELKNFQNQEKNTKIVESIAEDDTNKEELKLKINEYIKEIDKCIAQLSE